MTKAILSTIKHGGLLGLVCALAFTTPKLNAQTVPWGGSASLNPLSFDSHGNQDIQNHIWELGWFSDGFIPGANNVTAWAANWNSVDSGSFKGSGTAPDIIYAANKIYGDDNTPYKPAAVGKIMYTFVHNGGTIDPNVWGSLMGTPSGEALIYTRGQYFLPYPAPSMTFNIANDPTYVEDDNDFNLIWGRVDRNMYQDALWGNGSPASGVPANGGVMQGGGYISNPMADSQATPYDNLNGTFENQTASWVPEPSVAILSGFGMLVLLRRRRTS